MQLTPFKPQCYQLFHVSIQIPNKRATVLKSKT